MKLTIISLLMLCFVTMGFSQTNAILTSRPADAIRYAVIGDSYSIGEGASVAEACASSVSESWPSQLARHLTDTGTRVEVVANPSRTGWTTQQAIDDELPVWRKAKPEFASVQLGVNDWVQGVDVKTFHHRLSSLLDAMQKVLPNTN